jgi:hypothetical protein
MDNSLENIYNCSKIYIVLKTNLHNRRDKIIKVFSKLEKAYNFIKENYSEELENYEKLIEIDNQNKEQSILVCFIKEIYELISISFHILNI